MATNFSPGDISRTVARPGDNERSRSSTRLGISSSGKIRRWIVSRSPGMSEQLKPTRGSPTSPNSATVSGRPSE